MIDTSRVSESDFYHRLRMAEETPEEATKLAAFVVLYRAVTFVFQMSEVNDRRQDALQEAINRSGVPFRFVMKLAREGVGE